jgi:hypothetical protein
MTEDHITLNGRKLATGRSATMVAVALFAGIIISSFVAGCIMGVNLR